MFDSSNGSSSIFVKSHRKRKGRKHNVRSLRWHFFLRYWIDPHALYQRTRYRLHKINRRKKKHCHNDYSRLIEILVFYWSSSRNIFREPDTLLLVRERRSKFFISFDSFLLFIPDQVNAQRRRRAFSYLCLYLSLLFRLKSNKYSNFSCHSANFYGFVKILWLQFLFFLVFRSCYDFSSIFIKRNN